MIIIKLKEEEKKNVKSFLYARNRKKKKLKIMIVNHLCKNKK